jgi:hypothetical protein
MPDLLEKAIPNIQFNVEMNNVTFGDSSLALVIMATVLIILVVVSIIRWPGKRGKR